MLAHEFLLLSGRGADREPRFKSWGVLGAKSVESELDAEGVNGVGDGVPAKIEFCTI